MIWQQPYTPVADMLLLSFAVASIPIIVIFALLGGLRKRAHVASGWGLLAAFLLAVAVWRMPPHLALSATLFGAMVALVPFVWTLVAAVWLINLLIDRGLLHVIRESLGYLTGDRRLQTLLVGFGLNGLLEGLVAVGSPIAIIAAMLAALGFPPLVAAMVALLGDAHPGVWGPMGLPVLVMHFVTGLDPDALGAMVGRQTPLLALLVAPVLVVVVSGWKGLREVWGVTVGAGLAFAAGTFVAANYLSLLLAGVVGAVAAILTVLVVLLFWRPATPWVFPGESPPTAERGARPAASAGRIVQAWFPLVLLLSIVVVATATPLRATLTMVGTVQLEWPALHGQVWRTPPVVPGPEIYPAAYTSALLLLPGTLALATGVLSLPLLRMPPVRALQVYGRTLRQLTSAILTTLSVLGLAYLMNYSGMSLTIGLGFANAGGWFPFAAVALGLLGSGIAGTNTASNALFGNLVAVGAAQAGVDPVLATASLGSGGNMGKAVAPSALALAAGGAGVQGREGELLRRLVGISLVSTLLLGALAMLQHHFFPGVIP
jgi:L-lactate transport